MNTIPQDLAGYQSIEYGAIAADDIIVFDFTRDKFWARAWAGTDIPHFLSIHKICSPAVYRKMDVPRHDGETNHNADKTTSPCGKWTGRPMPDGQTFWTPNVEGVETNAKTDDSGKPPLATLPWKALRKVSQVQAYGHKKYGSFHNFKKGMEISRNLSCAIRHISEYMDGNDNDAESGESHLAHAACRLLFALENISEGKAIDDRYKS